MQFEKGDICRVLEHTTDTDLIDWINENEITFVVIKAYDDESQMVWVEGSDFGINVADIDILHRNDVTSWTTWQPTP